MYCADHYDGDASLTLGQFDKTTFIIDVNYDAEVKEKIGFSERGFATMWHEYTHFVQATSTFSGLAEINLLFDQIVGFSKDRSMILLMKEKSFEEMIKLPNLGETYRQLSGMRSSWYHQKKRDLIEIDRKDIPNYEVEPGGEIDGMPSLWLKIPGYMSSDYAIRLTRTIFTEGMARAIGEQITGPEISEKIRKNPDQIHYYALRLFIENWLPNVDPSLATIVIGDACLFDPSPATTFLNIFGSIKTGGSVIAEIEGAIRDLNSVWIAKKFNRYFAEERKEIVDYIDAQIIDLKKYEGRSANNYIAILFEFVKNRMDRRIAGNGDLNVLVGAKTMDDFKRMCNDYGCPVVRVSNDMFSFNNDSEQLQAWQTFCTGNTLVRQGLTSKTIPCPFSSGEVCKHEKKDETCLNDFWSRRINERGEMCIASHVADIMGMN